MLDPINDHVGRDNDSIRHEQNQEETTAEAGIDHNDASNNLIANKSTNTGCGHCHHGLMLPSCPNRIGLPHPFCNAPEGKKEWNKEKSAAASVQERALMVEDNEAQPL